MTKYNAVPFEVVNSPYYFYYKLIVDDVSHFDEFCEAIKRDITAQKNLNGIIALMDNFSPHTMLPQTKFRHIQGGKRSDLFEFKKGVVRVYVIKQQPNIYVVMGGLKNDQISDIKKFIVYTKDFPIKAE